MKVFMRRRAGLRPVFALLFSLALALVPTANSQQQCLPNLGDHYIGGMRPGSDGKIHVKYRFRDANGQDVAPNSAMQSAMEQGTQRWNAQSGTSKVVFEAAGPNDYADLIVLPSSDPTKTGGCAGVDTLFGYLYYDPALVTAAENGVADAATVIAHELGHFLALDDAGFNPNPPTIMNNPGQGMSCTDFAVPSTSPNSEDAAAAEVCVRVSRGIQAITSGSGSDRNRKFIHQEQVGPQCFDRYEVTDYYYCTSDHGCQYMYSDWDYQGTYCY